MTTAEDYAYAQTVIQRFTRDGWTQWQNVARILGRNIEDVRREFDLSIPPIPRASANDDAPASDPYPLGKTKVLCYLAKGPAHPEIIAASTGMTANAVRARLVELRAEGLVTHDGARGRGTSRTWSLTAVGIQETLTVCSIGSPRGAPSLSVSSVTTIADQTRIAEWATADPIVQAHPNKSIKSRRAGWEKMCSVRGVRGAAKMDTGIADQKLRRFD